MRFNYYSLGDDLLDKISLNNETIYILDSFSDKNILESQYKKEIFEKNPLFLTWSEFKEKTFLTDKFLLKEEKRTLLLYKAISPELKEKLNMRTYYDFIDYGENLLKFFKETRAYKVESLGDLEKWQEDSYETIRKIEKSFYKLLEDYNYIVPELLEDMKFFNTDFFQGYKNIEFINIFNFTEVEKNMLKNLNKDFNLNFMLKMGKASFDEENLEFLGLSLDESLKFNVEIFEVKDKFETMLNLVDDINNDKEYKIYSCDFENNKINSLISKNFISKKENPKFEESKLYKFLELIGQILEAKEIINGKKVYKIQEFFLALESNEFCRYFKINDFLVKKLEELFLKDEYKYINQEIIENHYRAPENFTGIKTLFDFLEELYNCKTLKDFTSFLSNSFEYKAFQEEKYSNLFDKYFEALTEIESNEMLEIDFEFNNIFDKNSLTESLFKLILKYLKAKPIDYLSLKTSETSLEDFADKIYLDKNKAIIIDISNETYPQKPKAQFLLNNKQKKKLGLPNTDKDKELMRYNFFCRLSSFESAKIYSIKNSEQNIDSSSFVDELMLNYGIEKTSVKYNSSDLSSLVKRLFNSELYIEAQALDKDYLPKENKDFGETYKFGAYGYNNSQKCLYQFFLNDLYKLDFVNRDIDYDFENRTMGIIIHSLYEKVFTEYEESIKNGDFTISKSKVNEIFYRIYRDNLYKIPKELTQYFLEILIPHYEESVQGLFYELSKELYGAKIEKFKEEENKEEILLQDEINLGIRGRADLVIESDRAKYIIDIKTGGAISSQLNFYELLYFGEGDTAKKYIYNAWGKKFEEKKEALSMDEFKVTLREFLDKEKYYRAEKKGTCRSCKYQNICRMRSDNE